MSKHAKSTITESNPRPDVLTGEFIETMKRAGVVEAYLFGSFARSEERPDSDVDVLVRFGHSWRLSEQLRLMVELSRIAGRDVEVVTKIDPVFDPYIRPTLVPIPL